MRYRNLCIGVALALLAVVAWFVLHRPPHQPVVLRQFDPLQDVFDSRALIPHTLPSSGPDPAVVAAFQNSQVAQKYHDIKPERSVLIYDCDQAWCATADFSFASLFQAAARLANPSQPDAEGLARAWYDTASQVDAGVPAAFEYSSLNQLPLQLLAVANRMDMATFDGTWWTGAEIHLAYGVASDGATPADFSLILEFVVNPKNRADFQSLAQTWVNLSQLTADQSAIPLRDALRASGIPLVDGDAAGVAQIKLRINHDVSAQWRLTQFLLDPASAPLFTSAALTDQISGMITPDSPLFSGLFQNASGSLVYPIPTNMLEGHTTTYLDSHPGLSMPSGPCNPSITTRHVLGLQECTMCHTAESGTHFQHLPNRLPGAATAPSAFLVGNTLHPELIDLYYQTQTAVSPVSIVYQTYAAPSGSTTCNVPVPVLASETRWFHDVARRTLFLAAEWWDQATARARDQPPSALHLSTQSIE
jgi:hypothetical protein